MEQGRILAIKKPNFKEKEERKKKTYPVKFKKKNINSKSRESDVCPVIERPENRFSRT